MIAEFLSELDGRDWFTITDQSNGDQRLIEVAPVGSSGVRPAEIVFVRYVTAHGPIDVIDCASSFIDQLKTGRLNGDFRTLFLSQTSREVSFTASLIDDALTADTFSVFRILQRPKVLVIIGYDYRGPIDNAQKSSCSKVILGIPADRLIAMSTLASKRVEAFNLMYALPNIKAYLSVLAAKQPDVTNIARSLIEGIEDAGREELGLKRFALVVAVLGALIKLHQEGYSFTGKEADEFASEAEVCAHCFRQVAEMRTEFHFALNLLARVLVTDPRRDLAKIERGMRIAQYLWRLGRSVEKLRSEEAMLSFLVGAIRISSVSPTQDAIERSGALVSAVRSQPVTVARLLARMAQLRLDRNNPPDRTSWLERLGQSDMATYMLDCSLGGATDSWFSGQNPGENAVPDMLDQAALAIRACPPELELRLASSRAMENKYWGEERAPLSLLRYNAGGVGVEAQSKLLGVDYEKQRELSDLRNSQIGELKPYLCFLRSFRSMRRLWVENAFHPGDPDIWPLITEPRHLTLEATLTRSLGVKFSILTLGGGFDMLGMGRLHVDPNSSLVEEDSWREHIRLILNKSVFVLLQPDTTAGVAWEIGEISRRGLINRTAIIMLPHSIDASAATCWRSLKELDDKSIRNLPEYRPEGGFVFFEQQSLTFGVLPFSVVFTGELSKFVLTKSACDRSGVARD